MRRSTSEKTRSRRVENLKRVAFFLCNGRARNKRKNSCSRASTRAHSRPKRKKRERVLFARDIEWKKNGGGGWKVATSAPFIRDWTTRSVGVAFVSFPKSSGLSLSLSLTHTHTLSFSVFLCFFLTPVSLALLGRLSIRWWLLLPWLLLLLLLLLWWWWWWWLWLLSMGEPSSHPASPVWRNERRSAGFTAFVLVLGYPTGFDWVWLGLTGFGWVLLGLTNAVASQCRFYGGKTSRRYKRDTTKLECEDIKG